VQCNRDDLIWEVLVTANGPIYKDLLVLATRVEVCGALSSTLQKRRISGGQQIDPGRGSEPVTSHAEFGPFEIDFQRRELRKEGAQTSASGAAFFKYSKTGRIARRSGVARGGQERLWPDGSVVGSDHSIQRGGKAFAGCTTGLGRPSPVTSKRSPAWEYRFIAEVGAADRAQGDPVTVQNQAPDASTRFGTASSFATMPQLAGTSGKSRRRPTSDGGGSDHTRPCWLGCWCSLLVDRRGAGTAAGGSARRPGLWSGNITSVAVLPFVSAGAARIQVPRRRYHRQPDQ
jgi:hypothetical protein